MDEKQSRANIVSIIIVILVFGIGAGLSTVTGISFGGLLLAAGIGLVTIGALTTGSAGANMFKMPHEFNPEFPETDLREHNNYRDEIEKTRVSETLPRIDLFKIGWIPLIVGVFLLLI